VVGAILPRLGNVQALEGRVDLGCGVGGFAVLRVWVGFGGDSVPLRDPAGKKKRPRG